MIPDEFGAWYQTELDDDDLVLKIWEGEFFIRFNTPRPILINTDYTGYDLLFWSKKSFWKVLLFDKNPWNNITPSKLFYYEWILNAVIVYEGLLYFSIWNYITGYKQLIIIIKWE